MKARGMQDCHGLGLMEVLTASAVLSVSIVCLLQLQLSARQLDIVSAQRGEASLLVLELSERLATMRYLRDVPDTIMMNADAAICEQGMLCTSGQFLQSEIALWMQQLSGALPDAKVDAGVTRTSDRRTLVNLNLVWSGGQHTAALVL